MISPVPFNPFTFHRFFEVGLGSVLPIFTELGPVKNRPRRRRTRDSAVFELVKVAFDLPVFDRSIAAVIPFGYGNMASMWVVLPSALETMIQTYLVPL